MAKGEPRSNAACECGHPYSEHTLTATKSRECVNYDPLAKSPWCGCPKFRLVEGRFLEPYRVPPEAIREFERVREFERDRVADSMSIPKKWLPEPAKGTLGARMAEREWSRFNQFKKTRIDLGLEKDEYQALVRKAGAIVKATFDRWPTSQEKALSYFGRDGLLDKVKVEKPLLKSKTARKKPKKSKIVAPPINKLTLARVPPVLDEEV